MEMSARGVRIRNKSVACQFHRFFLGRFFAPGANWRRPAVAVSNLETAALGPEIPPDWPQEYGVARRLPGTSPRSRCWNHHPPQPQNPVERSRHSLSPIWRVSNLETAVSNLETPAQGGESRGFVECLLLAVFPLAQRDIRFASRRVR